MDLGARSFRIAKRALISEHAELEEDSTRRPSGSISSLEASFQKLKLVGAVNSSALSDTADVPTTSDGVFKISVFTSYVLGNSAVDVTTCFDAFSLLCLLQKCPQAEMC